MKWVPPNLHKSIVFTDIYRWIFQEIYHPAIKIFSGSENGGTVAYKATKNGILLDRPEI